MTHVALARKYRPRRFADLVGQEHVAAGLAGAVARNRVAHAYLLTGPRGVGKTTAARILAMALNCEKRQGGRAAPPDAALPPSGHAGGEPCGECDSCQRIWAGSANLDVVEIDAASNRGVEDARDLRERAMYAASGPERHKVYIVDEAHMLTREAWNALLKVLEEPPPRVVFVFATTEPVKIANTAAPVLSRVQRFDFRRLGPQAVVERLRFVARQERLPAEEPALQTIARVAAGGMRDALSLLDQAVVFGDGSVTTAGVREALGLIGDDVYAELLGIIARKGTGDVFPLVGRLVDAGADLVEFVNGAGEMLRALMLQVVGEGKREAGSGKSTAGEISETLQRAVAEQAGQFRAGDVLRMLKLLAEAEQVLRRTPNARLHVETLLVQWTLLDRTVELADVMEALKGVGSADRRIVGSTERSRSGSPAAAPSPPLPDPAIRRSDGPPSVGGDPTLDALRARWPAILDLVGKKKRMLREALGHATPAALEKGVLTLQVEGAVHLEGLERSQATIVDALTEATGQAVRVAFEAGGAVPSSTPAAAPQRLDPRSDREARLRVYRSKDQALDAATDLLDLELSE